MEQDTKKSETGVTVNSAAYLMIVMSIVAVVFMSYFAKYLVGKWGESVGDMRYSMESNTLMDECEEMNYSSGYTNKEEKTDEDGDKYQRNVFICTYRVYEK